MDQAARLRNIIKTQDTGMRTAARTITVTSGKGGVGKSSISLNLAIQFQKMGKRVVVIDADFGLANIEVMLGIRPVYNLADLIFRGKDLADIITEGPEGVCFISGGSGIQELSNLSREQIMRLTQSLYRLDECADIIIIDTGAGVSDAVMEFVSAGSEILLVVTPEPTSITDSYALLKLLNQRSDYMAEGKTIKMIANRINYPEEGNEVFQKISVVAGRYLDIRLEFLGGIPLDSMISKAVVQQSPVTLSYPRTPASRAITEIAGKMENGRQPEFQRRRGIAEMFSKLMQSDRKGKGW